MFINHLVTPEGDLDGDEEREKVDAVEAVAENEFIDEKRLFVMNLSYQVTKEEL